MKPRHLATLLIALTFAMGGQIARADDVIGKLAKRYLGWKDLCAKMELVNIGKSGSTQEGSSKMCVLFSDDGRRYGRITVMSPAVARGMDLITKAELVGQTRSGKTQQWLYMPASKRATQINANNTESAFLGSEFSYADLDLAYLDPGRLKRLDEVACGKARCVRYAVADSADTQFSRIVWVAPGTGAVKQVEVLKQSKPYKVLTVEHETQHRDGWWVADKVVMRNQQTGGRTESTWENIRFNTGLTPADFDPKKIYGPAPSGRPK